MVLAWLAIQVGVVVTLLLTIALIGIVGPKRLVRLGSTTPRELWTVVPYLLLLGVILVVNAVTRQVAPEISWLIGVNITGVIYSLEGAAVATIQAYATPWLTGYFSFMYIYGYVFLLVFPLVAYFALDDLTVLKQTCLAYSFNYGLGLLCYVVFIAYGPRNLMPDLVDSLLYSSWPETQLLTSQVNTNTNVFPSLHTSLALLVVFLAYTTRDTYPRWLPVAGLFASSVMVATVYLGIHWITDVIVGGLLAVLSFKLAQLAVRRSDSMLRSSRRPSFLIDR